jgi:hypothetical protein
MCQLPLRPSYPIVQDLSKGAKRVMTTQESSAAYPLRCYDQASTIAPAGLLTGIIQ